MAGQEPRKQPKEEKPKLDPVPKTIVLVTGGFDPLHSGHIEYFKAAKAMGDHLAVGVNSDAWLKRKKGRHFMPLDERGAIISQLLMVDQVVGFEDDYDKDDSSINFIPEYDMIIIMTAREEAVKEKTLAFIDSHGLRYDKAIFGVHHGERIVVNDNKPGGLQTAIAWNVKRNKGYN